MSKGSINKKKNRRFKKRHKKNKKEEEEEFKYRRMRTANNVTRAG
jgi:hypothetical protein